MAEPGKLDASLFEAPPEAEQERMVEGHSLRLRRAGHRGGTQRPDAPRADAKRALEDLSRR